MKAIFYTFLLALFFCYTNPVEAQRKKRNQEIQQAEKLNLAAFSFRNVGPAFFIWTNCRYCLSPQ